MEYQKYNLEKFNLHIIKTKKFKKINIRVNYKRKISKDELTIRRLLVQVLMESSLKYKTSRELEIATEDLYALSIGGNNVMSGEYDIISFSTSFLNEKYTEPGMLNRSIEFLIQMILNPNVKNNQFNPDILEKAKRIIKDDIVSFSDYPSSYSNYRMMYHMAKNSPSAYPSCGYLKDLKKIDVSNLYEYYKSVIENDIIDIVIVGDVTEDIKNIFIDNFDRKNNNKSSKLHFLEPIKPKRKAIEIIEKQKINQSRLVIGCVFDELDDFELRYVLNVYSFILGGSGDSLLFKTVREKNSLCYSINSSYNIITSMLKINAGIDSKNYNKTVDLIKEAIDKMKNGEFNDDEVEKAKTIYKASCEEITDSPKNIINTYLSEQYLNNDPIDIRTKKIDEVTKDMVVSVANKIHINIIYMLEGVGNEN